MKKKATAFPLGQEVIFLPRKWDDIIVVSKNRLIHFLGNSHTGWSHISERHSIYSSINYFGFGKIGDPSKFNLHLTPIYDYVYVADDIYETGIKETKSHKNNDLFEKYKGKSNKYSESEGNYKPFSLIFYKNTRIVHSLYPEDDLTVQKPKRVLQNFGRCRDKIMVNQKLVEDWITINIPYENKEKIVRYIIVIRLNIYTTKGIIFIQVNDQNGIGLFTTFPGQFSFIAQNLDSPVTLQDNKFTKFLNGLTISDFSIVESKIGEIEKNFKRYNLPYIT